MSVSSQQQVVPLKAVEMDQLRSVLQDFLQSHQFITELESMNDSELQLRIRRGNKRTMALIERRRHRPLEVVVSTDFNRTEAPKTKPNRKSRGGNQSGFSTRWIWLLFIFSGLILSVLSTISQQLSNVVEASGLSPTAVIGISLLLAGLLIAATLYGQPLVTRWLNRSRMEFDAQVLELLVNRIEKLHQELTATDVLRCWSCFREIDFEDNVCSYCGERQK